MADEHEIHGTDGPGDTGPGTGPRSREERRRRTEASILAAAREQFADGGFERTTIRSVAAQAGVDPALVMQHFGNKERLFAAAARWSDDDARVLTARREELPAAAVDDLLASFEGERGEAAAALMRNCLTHPPAASVMRDQVMCDRRDAVARAVDGPDAELRAAVFGAVMMGVAQARYLLQGEPLASAPAEDLRRVLEPVLRVLLDGAGPGCGCSCG